MAFVCFWAADNGVVSRIVIACSDSTFLTCSVPSLICADRQHQPSSGRQGIDVTMSTQLAGQNFQAGLLRYAG